MFCIYTGLVRAARRILEFKQSLAVAIFCTRGDYDITEWFSKVDCFRRIGESDRESDREAHALNRIFWPICRFFVRKLQVGDKVKWQ